MRFTAFDSGPVGSSPPARFEKNPRLLPDEPSVLDDCGFAVSVGGVALVAGVAVAGTEVEREVAVVVSVSVRGDDSVASVLPSFTETRGYLVGSKTVSRISSGSVTLML